MRNFAKMRTICPFFVRFNGRDQKNSVKCGPFDVFVSMLALDKKITAKLNAFMLPDGEVDLNFLKGGI